jgi:hypothetical protein
VPGLGGAVQGREGAPGLAAWERNAERGREGRTGGTTTTAGEVVRAAAPLTPSSMGAGFRIAVRRLFPEAAKRPVVVVGELLKRLVPGLRDDDQE